MTRIMKKNILRSGGDLNPQPIDKHVLEGLRQFNHQVAGQFLGFVFNIPSIVPVVGNPITSTILAIYSPILCRETIFCS